MSWTAEITTDPTRDFKLYVELLYDDAHKARLQHNAAGELEVVFYGDEQCAIPWRWLAEIAERFQNETRPQ